MAGDHGALLRANVERILEAQGRTVLAFCRAAGMAPQQYYRAFTGPLGPTMATLRHWANVLGVDASEFFREVS